MIFHILGGLYDDVNIVHFKEVITKLAAKNFREWMWLGTNVNEEGIPIDDMFEVQV